MIKRRRSQLPMVLAAILAIVATLLTATALAQLPDRINSLILFPPDDTASNLDPGDPTRPTSLSWAKAASG